jgi:catechol 2,3-dioxygenase-like lactoylglutathione lyase family enzyme
VSETPAAAGVRLASVCFHVTDLERSIRFYGAVAGLVETARWEPEGMVEVALKPAGDPGAPGVMLMWRHPTPTEDEAAAQRHAAGLPQTGYSRLVLVVDDIEAARERIRAAGGRAGRAEHSDWLGVAIAFAKDPDGYVLELIEGGLPGL